MGAATIGRGRFCEGSMVRSKIALDPGERQELQRRTRAMTISVRDRQRAEIILLRADGLTQGQIASRLGVSRVTVNEWCRRFAVQRLAGPAPGRGRKPSLPAAAVRMVLEKAVTPPATLARWSCRTMAREAGISQASVQRLWAANDIKPHLWRTFKRSNDKQFEAKFWDVIGLYLDPPEKALVLCCDEQSQCQALERTQRRLPLKKGYSRTQTHDYIRHGTITLFAALSYLEGKIISRTEESHTHLEWLRFLKQIDRETPKELDLHLIVDNYATHKHPVVQHWLSRHPRFHTHFTPTSSSWLNLVERFFGELTSEVVREGSFQSLRQLVRAIESYLLERNRNPKKYVWRASGLEILEKIKRAKVALANEAVIST